MVSKVCRPIEGTENAGELESFKQEILLGQSYQLNHSMFCQNIQNPKLE